MIAAAIILAWLAIACASLAALHRRAFAAAWNEPVLRAPVLVLESDDWGYGPVEQAPRLIEIANVLAARQDGAGRHPVMTLGVVLAGPDTDRIRVAGGGEYHRITLADARLAAVRDAMVQGAARGVFSLQLHGMEHFWPRCLIQAAKSDERVRRWLTGNAFPGTEALPAALQSRWIDATALPSKALPTQDVIAAATEEVRAFGEIFGKAPEVVVPPTFVWTRDVERAWARAGIRVVVTPGRRSESRDAQGQVVVGLRAYHNGDPGPHGACHVVRDSYFEPALGHEHRRALGDLYAKTRLGQPALLEIHRMNFLGEGSDSAGSLQELALLLDAACHALPSVRFMSTSELAAHYRHGSDLVEDRIRRRVHLTLRRLARNPRLRKLAWVTGAIVPAGIVYLVTWKRATA